ncbi:hypothetical protein [Absidia glauca]|uniref:Uncharacterized protein n=1 Tax=Absidia glauca TaxID=4829 RepID=A0A163JHJ6_ABSGL|nr:hypothetical protein [Absidia glauca]
MEWYMFLAFSKIYQSPFLLCLYKVYKYLYRLTTRTTELYRICDGAAKELTWTQDMDGWTTNSLPHNNDEDDSGENNSDETDDNDADIDEKVGEISDMIPLLQTTSQHKGKSTLASYIPADVVFQVGKLLIQEWQGWNTTPH